MDAERLRAVIERARPRYAPREVTPLRLRAWLRQPITWDAYHGLTIEGAIQCVTVIRETGMLPDDAFAGWPRDEFADIPVPIADVTMCGRPIACASRARPSDLCELTTRRRRKRPEAEHYAPDRVMTNGGNFKALDIPVATLTTPFVDFFVRGDRAMLADMLVDVTAIGAGRSAIGGVMGWEIDPDPDDRALLYERTPQRPLPVADEHDAAITYGAGDYELRECATRAPYWHRATVALCAVAA